MLLEVVIAVGLLVLGFAVIGAQVQGSLERTRETDQMARVVFLAESKLAEIDTGLIIPKLSEDIEEDFTRLFPHYAWRARIEPLVDETKPVDPAAMSDLGLLFIKLDILYDPKRNIDEEFDYDNATLLKTFYTIRAAPRPLDLTADFGMEEDVADKLNEDLAGITGGDIDVRQFSPDIFRNLDVEQLVEIMPTLMQALGAQPSDILSLLPEEMRPQVEALLQDQLPSQDESGEGDQSGDGSQDNPDGQDDQSMQGGGSQGGRSPEGGRTPGGRRSRRGDTAEPPPDGQPPPDGGPRNPTGDDETRRGGNRRAPRDGDTGGGRR